MRRNTGGCCHATGWHLTKLFSGRDTAFGRPYRAPRERGVEECGPPLPGLAALTLGCQRPALRASQAPARDWVRLPCGLPARIMRVSCLWIRQGSFDIESIRIRGACFILLSRQVHCSDFKVTNLDLRS
jgi:hypothetical protein